MSTSRRLAGTVAVLTLTVTVSACQSADAPQAATGSHSPRPGSAAPNATNRPSEHRDKGVLAKGAHRFDVADARPARSGKDYKTVAVIPGRRPDGNINFFTAAAPDGELLGIILDPDTGGEGLPQQTLILKNPVTGSEQLIPSPASGSGPERQLQGVVASRRWVVWLETASTNMTVSDWVLYSYDRASGVVHRLATAPHRSGRHSLRPPDDSRPSIGGDGRVYLSAVRSHRGRPQLIVESVPVDGSGRVRIELRNAVFPTASGDFLTWAAAKSGLTVYRRRLSGGHAHKILALQKRTCSRGRGLGAAGAIVAWIVHCSGSDHLQVWRRGHVVADIVDPSSSMGYLRVTSRYVAEGSGSGPYRQYLYDVAAGTLLKVGHGNLAGDMPGNGAHLTWVSYRTPNAYGDTHVARLKDIAAGR